ncbi:MAG: hypothetical protein NZ585_09630 [Chloracidobacterium sp.]|nr:hypothetical protein [Chloracidobacterium sp.]MDW8216961.1 DNA glycosylase [Acidobacteriota bacterium]
MSDLVSLPADFNPDLTLCGGQAFRWTPIAAAPSAAAYQGVVGDAVLTVVRADHGNWQVRLLNHPPTPTWRRRICAYFDLDRDYRAAHHLVVERLRRLSGTAAWTPTTDPLGAFFNQLAGLRLLRQPWFETLVSFVVSANNHLPRIRQIIDIISRTFGQPLGDDHYAFPTPEALAAADPATLRTVCRVGYRDRYLSRLAQQISRDRRFWEHAATLPTAALRQALRTLPGVGPKVAECVLLFGFHRWEAFPVDVWVRRALAILLGDPSPPSPAADRRRIAAVAATLGSVAGLAQQYLFELMRRRLITGSLSGNHRV